MKSVFSLRAVSNANTEIHHAVPWFSLSCSLGTVSLLLTTDKLDASMQRILLCVILHFYQGA